MVFARLFTTLQGVLGKRAKLPPRPATSKNRPYANTGTNLSRDDAWKTLRLRKRNMVVDGQGAWWLIEERQCLHTGAIFKRTRRITD